MTPLGYRTHILAMVASLRTDPFDEVTRLVLADFTEEHGALFASGSALKWLRDASLWRLALENTAFPPLEVLTYLAERCPYKEEACSITLPTL